MRSCLSELLQIDSQDERSPFSIVQPPSLSSDDCFYICTQAARERYDKAAAGRPERLVSGSDDFTMFMWEASTSKAPLARMTGHMQLINQASLCCLAQLAAVCVLP